MANTKKFNEFIEEKYPQSGDYMVGYRAVDSEEFRIPLGYLNTAIIANRFIRKDIDDYADGVITFNAGLKTAGDVYSNIYLKGLNGWYVDPKGNMEVNSITAREYIETPELRKNRITVMGNQFWFTDSASIQSVTALGSYIYNVYWRLEEGEYGSFVLDDIAKGIFHYDTGFYTTYLRVIEEILDSNGGQIGVKMQSLNQRAPMAAMVVARMNNFTNEDRQGSIFADGLNKYIRVVDGFDSNDPTSEGSLDTLKVQMGDLSGIKNSRFGELKGYGLYAENVYLTGRLVIQNDPDAEGVELGVFRGLWDANTLYFSGDQVSYNGSLYQSLMNNNKGYTPVGDSTDPWWSLVVSKGDTGGIGGAAAILDITNDNTTIPLSYEGTNPILYDSTYGYIHTCEAYVFQGAVDISDIYNFAAYPSSNIVITTQSASGPFRIAITNLLNTPDWESSSIRIAATPKDSTSGYADLSITWSISTVRAGSPGDDATAYWVITDAPVIKKFKNGTFSPNPFIARAKAKTGEDPIVDFNGYWSLKYGTSTINSSGATLSFVPLSTATTYTIELYYDSARTTLLDKEIINVVEDGADGDDGVAGDWQIFIFYLGTTKPATPTFTTPPATYPVNGWYDYPNQDGVWWMSQAAVDGATNTIASWSMPIRTTGLDGVDGTDVEFIFRRTAENVAPARPGTSQVNDYVPSNWNDDPLGPTEALPYEWMCVRYKVNGVWAEFSDPALWARWSFDGEDGATGNSIEMRFAVNSSRTIAPSITVTSRAPAGWYVQAPAVASGYTLWMTTATISSTNALVGTWTTPVVVSGEDGDAQSGDPGDPSTSASLSSYAGVLLSTPSGTITGSLASTVLRVWRGDTALTYTSAAYPSISQFSITGVSNSGGYNYLTYSSSPTVGSTTVTYNVSNFSSTSVVTGYLDISIRGYGATSGSYWETTLRYYVNRVSNGSDGAPGAAGSPGSPGAAGQDANLLDWVENWNGNSVIIDGNKVVAGRVFAGTLNASGALTGVAMGSNVMKLSTGTYYSGLYGVKDGAMTFGIGVDGSAYFGGTISIGNSTFLNADGTGSLAFGNIYWLSDGSLYVNNVNMSGTFLGVVRQKTAYTGVFAEANIFHLPSRPDTDSYITMGYGIQHIGKVIQLYNSAPLGSNCVYWVTLNTFGVSGISATYPNGTSVNASLGTVNALLRDQESITVTCYETDPGTYDRKGSWQIQSRFNHDQFKDSRAYGRFPRCMALGTIRGTATTAYVDECQVWSRAGNYNAFTVTRLDRGVYRVLVGSWLSGMNYHVMLSGGVSYGYESDYGSGVYPALWAKDSTSFTVRTADDSSNNDGTFYFMIFQKDYWNYDLTQ